MVKSHNWSAWLIVLGAVVVLLTADRWRGWWAWDFLGYVPWSLRLAGAGLVLMAAAPWWGNRIRLPEHVRQSRSAWVLLPFAAALFWLLRERTHSGDALLKLHLLETRSLQTDPYVWKEPLDAFLAYTVSRWLPPETAVALMSVTAGVIYLAGVLALSQFLGFKPAGRAAVCIGLLALGSTQLWFGHVENYSLVTAASVVMMAAALRWLQIRDHREVTYSPDSLREGWLIVVGIAAGLAVSFHPQASFTLPALLVLPQRSRWWRQLGLLVVGGLVGPLLTVLLLRSNAVPWPDLSGGFAGDTQLFWTPVQAFERDRLRDALNNLWLVAPLAPLILLAGILGVLWLPLRQDKRFQYLSVMAGSLLVYHFFFQNDLPRPQDWDLFAMVGPGLTLWGLYAWLRLAIPGHIPGGEVSCPENRRPVAQLLRSCATLFIRRGAGLGMGIFPASLMPALAFALVTTALWVGVNHVYTLLLPNPDQRELYSRYRLQELAQRLPEATVWPESPLCDTPAADPTRCRRVTLTTFIMPQDGDMRPVIFAHAPAQVTLPLAVPHERNFLWLSPALDPLAWGWGGDGVTFQVRVRDGIADELLWSQHLTPADPRHRDWQEVFLSLDRWRGQEIELVLETLPGPAGDSSADRAGWGLAWLMRGTIRRHDP